MNGSKMKRIMIRFLLVCNLLLLALILLFAARSALRERSQSKELVQMMQDRGVVCASSVYNTLQQEQTAYTLSTDTEAQDTFCRQFLVGSVVSEARSGGSIAWTSDSGEIVWSTDGSVSGTANLSSFGIPADENDAKALVRKLMKKSGVRMNQTAMEAVSSDGGYVVRVQEGVAGQNLTGCELKVSFDTEGNAVISGRWCFGTPEKAKMDALDDSTPADILLALTKAQPSVTQVYGVRQVYILSNKSGGRFTLLPCWKITTDQGDFVINPLTGEEVTETTADTQTAAQDSTSGSTTNSTTGGTTDSTTATDGWESSTDGQTTGDTVTQDPSEDTSAADDTPQTDSSAGEGDTTQKDPEEPDANGFYG